MTTAKAVVSLEEYIRRVVDAAPPLSDAQRNRIAALLRPVAPIPAKRSNASRTTNR